MQFFKQHFEKIILSAVLAGLGAAALWLYMAVEEARSATATEFGPPATAKPMAGVESNLAPLRAALKTLTNAPALDLAGEHNLFNPITWKTGKDGIPFKMRKAGVDALAVTDIRPLYFTISLQSQVGDGFYLLAQPPMAPKARAQYYKLKAKPTPLTPYTLVSTNSAPDKSVTLQLLLPETQETVSLSANSPYKRVEGYEADLKYSGSDSTNLFARRHVEDALSFSGESFKIIGIASNAVTVQDARTTQRTVKEWKGGQ